MEDDTDDRILYMLFDWFLSLDFGREFYVQSRIARE